MGSGLGGALVAVVILVFLPLPRVTFGGRLRPLALAEFVGRFVVELVAASVHVGWVTVRPGPGPRNAIVAVRLRVRSDLNLALTAEALSLVPGTLIVYAAWIIGVGALGTAVYRTVVIARTLRSGNRE